MEELLGSSVNSGKRVVEHNSRRNISDNCLKEF